ncbi:hypothetical protein FE257_007948 [Aspergillus nanangensis]|uniref:Uncharacterized protein n=1 Tax=Aspergillus nanangensis TaxID=2582783 RepID=A0AAD4GZ70_ASPNN|nr:hypothetical protein FE257_007948 [Aspergillus nanangensis]
MANSGKKYSGSDKYWRGNYGVNPGIDDNGYYIKGTPVYRQYREYKQANKDAGDASSGYKDLQSSKEAQRPAYQNRNPTQSGPKMRHIGKHEQLGGLAGYAASTAKRHADLREGFNTGFKKVLEKKNELAGHVQQAENARRSEEKYTRYERNNHVKNNNAKNKRG